MTSPVLHHVVWPEGLPDEAFFTTSWWRMQLRFARLQFRYLLRLHDARRIRHALSWSAYVKPREAEARIELLGGIAPRQGWPRPAADPSDIGADARIVTHSVL